MRQTVKQNMMTGPIELTGSRCVRPLKMVMGISAHTALGLGTGDGPKSETGRPEQWFRGAAHSKKRKADQQELD